MTATWPVHKSLVCIQGRRRFQGERAHYMPASALFQAGAADVVAFVAPVPDWFEALLLAHTMHSTYHLQDTCLLSSLLLCLKKISLTIRSSSG